ncbi:hypothetical protein HAT86_12045 [Roseovarius gahaiensis]|uniref:Uncharacterized protein n=1 Tax=Roseovarius gahaiensis TaxID=2716691 RepID=A0A967BBZ1_9RHOB|nr:hypothetical protein [Roseovarius gahaiensis]NHQ75187.1 hypothetical protein [Roseovarius gahaiensis]
MRKQNRAAIRAAKKNADKIAAVMAQNALQPDGRNGFVSNPTARKVLARGFADLIRNNCKPIVLRVTAAEAGSLPGCSPTPKGAQSFCAFGLDVGGRGTWCLRWAFVRGLPPEEARDQIEVRMLADLARVCNVSGFPVSESMK